MSRFFEHRASSGSTSLSIFVGPAQVFPLHASTSGWIPFQNECTFFRRDFRMASTGLEGPMVTQTGCVRELCRLIGFFERWQLHRQPALCSSSLGN